MDQESYGSFARMATSRDTPNPLRPYYIPPTIGLPADLPAPSGSSSATYTTSSKPSSYYPSHTGPNTTKADFRELFSDIDYGDYLPDSQGGSVAGMAKKIVDQAMWNYASVFLAQPFEVAKIVLQVCDAGQIGAGLPSVQSQSKRRESARYSGDEEKGSRPPRQEEDYFNQESEESDDDAPSYFTSIRPDETPSSPYRSRTLPKRGPSRSHSSTPTPASFHRDGHSSHSDRLELRHCDSILEVLSQLWAKESALGVWKGTNATFVYNVLLKTVETWTRSLLSALVNVPDPATLGGATAASASLGHLNILDSPSPLATLGITVAAAGIAGLLLAPLDIVRTRLIITPRNATPRALVPALRSLPSISVSASLLPITLLNSTIPSFISSSMPLFLRSTLRIDPTLTPTTYSISTFILSLGELFIKLPLETVLRRGHVATLQRSSSPAHTRSILPTTQVEPLRTVVPTGTYRGVMGTIWHIAREEGMSTSVTETTKASVKEGRSRVVTRRGQGMKGLWRGWRVGFWGLVGVWGASALGGGSGGEF